MGSITDRKETELVKQIQKGDGSALGQLLSSYQQRIYHTCYRMVNNAETASDLTQETFAKVIEGIGSFKGNSSFGTWITRIAMNETISFLRKSKHRNAVSLDKDQLRQDGSVALKALLSSRREPPPSSGVEREEEIEQLVESIDELEVELRTVIVLRDLQEMDYKQIADVLNIPVGTVKSRLFRARLHLRQILLKKAFENHQREGAVAHG